MNAARQFREAVEDRALERVSDLLAEDVVFHSPVTYHPFVGRETVTKLLMLVGETFENFRYTDEIHNDREHVLVFHAQINDRELEGIDLLRIGSDGLIEDFTVMIRPLSGLMPFAEAMKQKVNAAALKESR